MQTKFLTEISRGAKAALLMASLRSAIMVVGLGFTIIIPATAGDCYWCAKLGKWVPSKLECPDPAFLGVDSQPSASLAVTRIKAAKLPDKVPLDNLSGPEVPVWQEFERRIQADPKNAIALVMECWTANYSDCFHRMAIFKAKSSVKSTEEIDNLNFMLACLEDSKLQKEKCLSLGKGNGLERKLAARRLALMTSNPKLAGE